MSLVQWALFQFLEDWRVTRLKYLTHTPIPPDQVSGFVDIFLLFYYDHWKLLCLQRTHSLGIRLATDKWSSCRHFMASRKIHEFGWTGAPFVAWMTGIKRKTIANSQWANPDYKTGLVGAAAAVQALLIRLEENATFDIDISFTQNYIWYYHLGQYNAELSKDLLAKPHVSSTTLHRDGQSHEQNSSHNAAKPPRVDRKHGLLYVYVG